MLQSRRVSTVLNWLVSVSGKISGYAILTIALLITGDVILRLLFNAPTKFATELSSYLLVITVSMGLAYTLKERGHIKIDVLTSHLPKRVTNWLQVITSFSTLMFTCVILWLSWLQFYTSFVIGTTSRSGFDVVVWPVQLFIPLGLLLISLLLIRNTYVEAKVVLGKTVEIEQIEEEAGL